MNNNIVRIEVLCSISGEVFKLWVDTGSPNTLISTSAANALKLPHNKGLTHRGKIAGLVFRNKPSVTIPKILIPECLPLRNVRAIAALDGDEWENIIILGLNVLNHLTYQIKRNPLPGTFEWIEELTSTVPNANRTRFDHVISEGRYLLTDED